MRAEIQLAAPPIGYVRVELGRGEVGVAEHLLDAAEIGAAFEQMGSEGMSEQVRVHAQRLKPRHLIQCRATGGFQPFTLGRIASQ